MSWRMVRVEGIEAVDLVVGSPTFAAKGAAKRWGTLAGFRAPPSIWRFRLAALAGRARRPSLHESFGGVTGFFLDGAKYFSLGLRSFGRGGGEPLSIDAKSK